MPEQQQDSASRLTALARELMTYMRDHNLNSAQLAERVGLPKQTLRNIINGKHVPHDGTLAIIAQKTGLQFDRLRQLAQTPGDGVEDFLTAYTRLTPDERVRALLRLDGWMREQGIAAQESDVLDLLLRRESRSEERHSPKALAVAW